MPNLDRMDSEGFQRADPHSNGSIYSPDFYWLADINGKIGLEKGFDVMNAVAMAGGKLRHITGTETRGLMVLRMLCLKRETWQPGSRSESGE